MPRLPYDLESRRPYLVQTFSDAEYDRRTRATCDAMMREGLDALIVYAGGNAPAAVTYLTNYVPVYGNAFVVLHADGRIAVTADGMLHAEPMHSMIWTCRVADVRIALGSIYGGPVDEVASLAADAVRGTGAVGAAKRAGLVGASLLPHTLYATLASRLPELRPADHVLAGVRMVKSDEEIAKMREAGRIADEAYGALFAVLAPGVEETTVAAAAVHRMNMLGGREGFVTSVVSGAQAGLKHGHPRRKKLVEGEMVFTDLGVRVDGYMSDVSRCTAVGRPQGSARDLLQVGLDLHHAGLQVMGPGKTIDDVSNALLAVVRGTKYEPYYCAGGFGHGIGMAVLETPGLYAGNKTELRPRMTVAYEPMVVMEGLGTGVVEDTLLITETGYERLSNYPAVTWL
jgi:Xaa-Pro aminopeptidase